MYDPNEARPWFERQTSSRLYSGSAKVGAGAVVHDYVATWWASTQVRALALHCPGRARTVGTPLR
jgi:hypothetical protein